MSKHWSNEDLINKLYGIGPDDSHLDECGECRARWLRVQARRSSVIAEPSVSPAFLQHQRNAIQNRIDGRRSVRWPFQFAPAMAALCVVVLGLVLLKPAPPPEPSLASLANDGDFYAEVYSMVESPEPWVTEPMYGLFEDD